MIEYFDDGPTRRIATITKTFDNDAVCHLNSEPHLNSVRFRICEPTSPIPFQTKLNNTKVKQLNLENCTWSLCDVVGQSMIDHLQGLVISNSPNGLKKLDLSKALIESFYLRNQEVSDLEIRIANSLVNLKRLAVSNSNICDKTFFAIVMESTEQLDYLDLGKTDVSLCDCPPTTFSSLRTLHLDETSVTDNSIKNIELLFPTVVRLYIEGTKVSRDGVFELSKLRNLKVLRTDFPDLSFDRLNQTFFD